MEHLDNDMDDLFHKAGELYPLKTTGSDWDAVAGKLRDESFSDLNAAPGLTSRGNRNKRRWLLLLLLLPLGYGIAYMTGTLTQKNTVADNTSGAVDKTKTALSKSIIENKPVVSKEQPGVKTADETAGLTAGSVKANNEVNGKKNKVSSISSKMKVPQPGDKDLTTSNNPNAQKKIAAAAVISKTRLDSKNESNGSEEAHITGANKTSNTTPTGSVEPDPLQSAALVAPAAVAKENEKGTADKKADSAVVAKTVSADSSVSKKKSVVNAKHSKGFYVGLLVGPDVSSVKLQSVKQLGFSAGILAGFRFNERFAIETGFIWDQKYYYTSGEYFKNNMPYPPNSSVNGHCDMIEIPLLVRYDFAASKNHGFFAKAGFSSYLMTHQYYSKKVNGQDFGSWPVTQQQNYYFSVAQISAGYEFSINGKTKIQIEPYLKIPLQGLGEGSLPISSAGIYFGITRSFR
jgi:Outer membrane protein beta-barrel domain